jgi:hypothetical protein
LEVRSRGSDTGERQACHYPPDGHDELVSPDREHGGDGQPERTLDEALPDLIADGTLVPEPPKPASFDMPRYRELRAEGVGEPRFDQTQRTGFWKRVVDPAADAGDYAARYPATSGRGPVRSRPE